MIRHTALNVVSFGRVWNWGSVCFPTEIHALTQKAWLVFGHNPTHFRIVFPKCCKLTQNEITDALESSCMVIIFVCVCDCGHDASIEPDFHPLCSPVIFPVIPTFSAKATLLLNFENQSESSGSSVCYFPRMLHSLL